MKIFKKKILIIITIILLIVSFSLYFRIPGRLFAEFLDSEQHFLPCDKLPKVETVKEVMNKYGQEIAEIEKAYGHCVWFGVSDGGLGCKETGDIQIGYCSHQQRVEIKNKIGKTFHDIPWRGINQ